MISSLPKPLQNDFDTIVIDLLSRYSLDNKSVQKLVQTVAQQVRKINNIPRTLRSTKSGINGAAFNDNKAEDGAEKPNFITRFQNLQTTFNKGGLLGVLFESLKNKQTDAKAKIALPENTETENSEKLLEQTTPQEFKLPQQNTEILEKIITSNEKLQEAFDSKGLINIVQNIFNLLKKRSDKTPNTTSKDKNEIIPVVSSTTRLTKENTAKPTVTTEAYTTDTQINKTDALTIKPQSTNYSTINTSTAQTTDNTSLNTTNLTTGESQAQTENLLPDEIEVVLGKINDEGEADLKRVLKSVFEDIMPKEKRGAPAKKEKERGSDDTGGLQFGGLIGLLSNLGGMSGLLGKVIPLLTKFGSALGVAGAAVAGNYIGGQVGKMIGSDEKFSEYWYGSATAGKEAYEKYGTGIEGFTAATYDLIFGEGKQLREEAEENKQREERIKTQALERSKKSLEGSDVAKDPELYQKTTEGLKEKLQIAKEEEKKYREEYEKAKKGALEGWNPFHDETAETTARQAYEARQFLVQKLENSLIELEKINPQEDKQQIKSSETISPSMPSSTINTVPEVGDAIVRPDGGLLVSSPKEGSLFQLSKNDGIIAGPVASSTSLTPQTTKIFSQIPSSITETHITNNNADKKVLSDIAGNTENTNKTLSILGDAVFKLAKVLDSKTMGGGNSVLINNNGQVQEYTSTAQIAANNRDSIRVIRQEFLAAI